MRVNFLGVRHLSERVLPLIPAGGAVASIASVGGLGWERRDHGVPLADHAELALRCDGMLIPIKDAGHAPFLECPIETVAWIRATAGDAALDAALAG